MEATDARRVGPQLTVTTSPLAKSSERRRAVGGGGGEEHEFHRDICEVLRERLYL